MSGGHHAYPVSEQTEKEGAMPGWCPLSQQPCREDCEWLDVEYRINEEGIARETYCAIAVIAGGVIAGGVNPSEVFGCNGPSPFDPE